MVGVMFKVKGKLRSNIRVRIRNSIILPLVGAFNWFSSFSNELNRNEPINH